MAETSQVPQALQKGPRISANQTPTDGGSAAGAKHHTSNPKTDERSVSHILPPSTRHEGVDYYQKKPTQTQKAAEDRLAPAKDLKMEQSSVPRGYLRETRFAHMTRMGRGRGGGGGRGAGAPVEIVQVVIPLPGAKWGLYFSVPCLFACV